VSTFSKHVNWLTATQDDLLRKKKSFLENFESCLDNLTFYVTELHRSIVSISP